jgi:Ca2+-binding EF-hand superfamily protein
VQNNIKIDSAVDYDQNGRITKQEMKQYIVEIEKEKSNLNKEIKVMIEQMEECESYLIYEHR